MQIVLVPDRLDVRVANWQIWSDNVRSHLWRDELVLLMIIQVIQEMHLDKRVLENLVKRKPFFGVQFKHRTKQVFDLLG